MSRQADIVQATPAHAAHIAANMRQADRDEVWASGRHTAAEAVARSIQLTPVPLVGLGGGVPVCIFGIAPRSLLTGDGIPWLLGTDGIAAQRWSFVRECRLALSVISEGYETLTNHVDARNTASIRWLRWLGFQIEPAAPFGIYGLPFHRFSMRVSHV